MAEEVPVSQPTDSFEYMLFEGDPDHLKPIVLSGNQISRWIDPNTLKLGHRIGRGPFGDVWLATHYHCTEDYDQYHEVAIKMLFPFKEDHMQELIAKFNGIFSKCQGLMNVCHLYGISTLHGRLCIVMKFYEGSIGDKMALCKGGKLCLPDVLRYGVELARGILELHSRRILVLNLKPCNFLLDENDHAILGDFGIPFLFLGSELSSSELAHRLGVPHYMAPEQWQPSIGGPISFETDSWVFGCSIVEMLSGYQPWQGKSVTEVYNLVVRMRMKPSIPSGLPPELENILYGCFEYDFRDRPLMAHVMDVLKSCRDSYKDESCGGSGRALAEKSCNKEWSLLKDILQVGDTVRSRRPKNSCKQVCMAIPEGTVVGMESKEDGDDFVLLRVPGFHQPLKVHSSMVERVTHGFAAGDWVRSKEEGGKHSRVGVLHAIRRDGRVAVAFVGMETLWEGDHSELQTAESYFVGQFLRIKSSVSSPRFDWPGKKRGEWATGKVLQILPNGCLVVTFPGRLSFGEAPSFLADPSEVEAVCFASCDGFANKYWHLEDCHWAVRPLVIALGFLAALKMGIFVRSIVSRPTMKKDTKQQHQQDEQNESNSAWFCPSVANILLGEDAPSSR